jgi:bacterioferritin (cytochrome b1)
LRTLPRSYRPQYLVVLDKDARMPLYPACLLSYADHVMHADETGSNQRFTVKEAAQRLNVSEAAIRQRIQRNSIAHEKDEETNRVYIILDGEDDRLDDVEPDVEHRSGRELIDTLQEQLRLEREASAELRRIIAGLTQRIPAVEAPSDEREGPVSASEKESRTEAPPEPEKRSWWRRFFGVE